MPNIFTSRIPAYIAAMRHGAQKDTDDTALAIVEASRAACDIKTGSAQAAIYAVTSSNDGYGAASGSAQALNPTAVIVPEIDKPAEGHAVVSSAVAHGTFLELGTVKMSAHPYLAPSAENEQD